MRRFAALFSLFACLCLCTGTALAHSTSMTLVSVGGNNAGGVYTYPYNISVDGTTMSLICDTYDNHIDIGETWDAKVVGLMSGKGFFGNSSKVMLDYKASALIFKGILDGTISANEGNFAIWGFFSGNARSNPYFTSSGAGALESQYLALAGVAPNRDFWGFTLYNPLPGSQSQGRPQEFMGYNPTATPEPASVIMFLTGLFSLLAVLRRKLRTA